MENLRKLLKQSNHRSECGGEEDVHSAASAVVVSCPCHSGVPDLWPIKDSYSTDSVRSLGAQVRKVTDDGLVMAPEVEWVVEAEEPRKATVVGRADCPVVRDAYEMYLRDTKPSKALRRRMEPIRSLVKEAFDSGLVGAATPTDLAFYKLVEYNVARQAALLSDRLGDGIVAGYVYDTDRVYGDGSNEYHLVALNHDTEADSISSSLPGDEPIRVSSVI